MKNEFRYLILMIGLFFITPFKLSGATINYSTHITPDPSHDSSIYILYQDGVFSDSVTTLSDTVFVLDDIYNWIIWRVDFWDGSSLGYPEYPPFIYGVNNTLPVHITVDPFHDSTLYIIYRDGLFFDSTVALNDTVLTLGSAFDWVVWSVDYWDGSSISYLDPPLPLIQCNATVAAITDQDKQDIVRLLIDSAMVHPEYFYGPNTFGGTAPNNITIFAIDSLSGDTLSGIDVYAYSLTGSLVARGLTGNRGSVALKLELGNWLISAGNNMLKYSFVDTNLTVAALFDTFSVLGYENKHAVPADPNTAKVMGDIYSFQGVGVPGVVVTLRLQKTINVISSSSGITIGNYIGVDTTGVDGHFEFPAIRSFILDDVNDSTASLYYIEGMYKNRVRFVLDYLRVPDTGNVDLTEQLKLRLY